jgi:hypothetical protein
MYAPHPQYLVPIVAGTRLTLSKQAQWPAMCVKCATTLDVRPRTQRFQWFPQWTYALLLVGLIPAAIVQMVLTKHATLVLPVCAPCGSRWTMARVAYVFSIVLPLLLGLVLACAGAAEGSKALMFLGLFLMIPGMIILALLAQYMLVRPRTVRAVFIDDWAITLDGVAPQVLDVFRPRG